jgi:carbon starvation protein
MVCTLTAAWQKIFDANPRIGFLAHADKYRNAIAEGQVLAPAKSIEQMQQVIFNDYVNASLAALFMLVLLSMLVFGARTVMQARARREPSAREAPFELLPAEAALRP